MEAQKNLASTEGTDKFRSLAQGVMTFATLG